MIRHPLMVRISVPCLALLLAGCAAHQPGPGPRAPHAQPPPPRVQPRALVGMSEVALRNAMGAPTFVRKDGVTVMWRYDGAACRAFFFLYGTKGAMAVRHVETLPRGAKGAADADCLTALEAASHVSPPKTS